jgi:hypothetical protein
MAAHQELSWPPVRTFMSAYKENLMAADTRSARTASKRPCKEGYTPQTRVVEQRSGRWRSAIGPVTFMPLTVRTPAGLQIC